MAGGGGGEVKAATAALELPLPESVGSRALWSVVCDKLRKGQPTNQAAAVTGRAKSKKDALIPGFDPTAHVVSFLGDLFTKEKFRSPLERQEFALEITSYARELALRIRRERAKERHLAVSGVRKGRDPGSDQHSGGSARNAGAVSRLRESIRTLDQHVKKLSVATGKINPSSANSSSLSRTSEAEFVRLRDAVEKIAGQIQGTEETVRILLAKRAE